MYLACRDAAAVAPKSSAWPMRAPMHNRAIARNSADARDFFIPMLSLVKSDGRDAIESCHGPYRKSCGPLLSDARRTFFQVQGPGPVRLEQAGGGGPVNVLHVGERMPRWQGRA